MYIYFLTYDLFLFSQNVETIFLADSTQQGEEKKSQISLPYYTTDRFVAVEALTEEEEEESSEDAVPQQEITGTLVSPVLEYSEWSCLRLVYQIMGSGSLKVLQRTEGKSFDKPLWSGQTPSDSWVITSMDLKNNTESYKVLFKIIHLGTSTT